MAPNFLFFSLNVRGAPVGQRINYLEEVLIKESMRLVKDGGKKRNFKENLFEGQIRTEHKNVLLGSLRGVMFSATVEGPDGKTLIDYAVDVNVLKHLNEQEKYELQKRFGDLFKEMDF